jgi:hypothetical protein
MPQSEAQRARNRLGGLARKHAEPEIIEQARDALELSKIRDQVAAWPKLTDAQRIELARLLLSDGAEVAS